MFYEHAKKKEKAKAKHQGKCAHCVSFVGLVALQKSIMPRSHRASGEAASQPEFTGNASRLLSSLLWLGFLLRERRKLIYGH
jgi:hypothetical protein